ncbi:MAG: hypothetical protein ABR499_22050, partial [Gemmatimonadaceae bacterium]
MESGQTNPLLPDLRDAELTLDRALAEACSGNPPRKADTGELIRIEEALQIASDAAKRAISLRRRRRADKTQRAARWAMGDAEVAASLGATHRNFTDARGVWWDVFAVYPEVRVSPHLQLKGTFKDGWLCFDSGAEKRRLSPIPDDWRTMSDADLERLAERAEVASSRRRRPPRTDPGT